MAEKGEGRVNASPFPYWYFLYERWNAKFVTLPRQTRNRTNRIIARMAKGTMSGIEKIEEKNELTELRNEVRLKMSSSFDGG